MESFGSAWARSRRIRRLRSRVAQGESVGPVLAAELLIRAAQLLKRERPGAALSAVDEAVTLHDSGELAPRQSRIALAETISMKALVLCELGRFEEAESTASEALRLAEKLREEKSDAQVLGLVRTAHHLLAACGAGGGDGAQW